MSKSKWSEIKNDYTDDKGVTHIDAFLTPDDNEGGSVIALVIKGSVYYKDFDAMTDKYAQEVIQEAVGEQIGDPTKKYYYKVIGVRSSDYEFELRSTQMLDKDVDPAEFFDDYVKNFYCNEGEDDFNDKTYYFFGGEVCAWIHDYKEIEFDEYKVLKKFIY